jgi:flagellar protein FlaF
MYDEVLLDSASEARRREREAFDDVISKLMLAKQTKSVNDNRAAIDAVETLWMFLLEDLVRPGNALAQELKARLISIGLWILKEVTAQRVGQNCDLAALIDVNQIIRDGLE